MPKCCSACSHEESYCQDLSATLHKKVLTTLSPIIVSIPPFDPQWFNDGFKEVFAQLSLHVRMCWLKSITGAWCTSVRLHSIDGRQCISGSIDSKDEVLHYLECPILWQFARENMRIQESSILVSQRLCLCGASIDKLKLLAFCHALYHSCVNGSGCMTFEGFPHSSRVVQLRARGLVRNCFHMVGGE